MSSLRPVVFLAAVVAACVGGCAAVVATAALATAVSAPAGSAPSLPPAGTRGWQRPVSGEVLRLFSVGPDRYAAGQHRGVDLAAPPRTPVRAACGGRVTFVGRVPRGGRTVSVRCGGLVATYQHLGAIAVRRGQHVAPGGAIGRAGSARPRPHVHLGARVAATGRYVDPLALLTGAPRAAPPPLPAARPAPPLVPRTSAPARVRVRPVPLPVLAPQPLAVPAQRPAAHDPRDGVARMPWPVWLGLALLALGLPLGGIVRVRVRRGRARARAAQVAT